MTKSEMTTEINKLKKLGFLVYNFNGGMPRGSNGWVDYVIIKRKFVFLECKLGRDKLSKEQEILKAKLCWISLMQGTTEYYIINESNYKNIIDYIAQNC